MRGASSRCTAGSAGTSPRTWETQACIRQMNREGVAWKRTSYGTVLMETDGKDWYVNQDYSSEKVKKQEKAEQKKK
jgi:hypothetical protein